MTARSDLGALVALGARLRDAGATPASTAPRTPSTHADAAAGVARLRALLSGDCAQVGTHEGADGLTPEQLRAYAARYSPEASRRSLGRTGGYNRPQCPGCRAFLKHEGAQCSNCGFMGNAGYLSVPAKTTIWERWR